MFESKENVLIEAQTLGCALEFLTGLVKEKKRPDEAIRAFNIFREQNKHLSMDIVWEEERYTDAANYDIIFHLAGEGSVSLSFCPDRAVPWVLRHAHNPEANIVLRVNEAMLNVETVMAYLDFIWDEAPVVKDLVNKCLIREAIQKRAIEVSDEELQQAMDEFRKKHGLYSAEKTQEWMNLRGTTQERIEGLLCSEIAATKLKNQIVDEQEAQDYFENHRADFDTAQIARFKVADEAIAQNVYNNIRSGETDFFTAAQDYYFSSRQKGSDMFTVVRRGNLSSNHASSIFAAYQNDLIEPMQSGNGYDIVRILRVNEARFDEPTREIIKTILFNQWLEKRRAESSIEWFWGKANVSE